MKKRRSLALIGISIIVLASITTGFGILSNFGEGSFQYVSIRGVTIDIYGKGIYQHMSSDVAIQGIAQDYVTLFIAIPMLILSLISFINGNVRANFVLAGTFGYFFVTYLFYLSMGMYNYLFLIYTTLLCLSFFGLFMSLQNLFRFDIHNLFSAKTPCRFVGWFLMINAVLIALLWLGVVLPPLIDGTIYPIELNHYTTLIVQGFDLGLLLPICFVSGLFLTRKKTAGYIYGTVYLIFLAILMTALSAKIMAMAIKGVNVIPVIFIIPIINIIAISSAVLMIKSIGNTNEITTVK